ncbi:class I SAM-dependent methyltransferase [Roseomonas sp. GCM10028921]
MERHALRAGPRRGGGTASVAFDIGVRKGQSVARLADTMRRVRPDSALLSIDTFLGRPGHWDRSRADRIVGSLGLVHGWPSLHCQLLSNMVLSGHAERIVPLPQTSDNAAVIFTQLRLRPELIHIDAAHEYEPVKRDIENYWALLMPGGLMVGDDNPWPGVKKAADEFAAARRLYLQVEVRSGSSASGPDRPGKGTAPGRRAAPHGSGAPNPVAGCAPDGPRAFPATPRAGGDIRYPG